MENTAKLLGAKVQMKSMEVVLLPMARQVSELTLMYHAAGHVHPPGHTMRARAVADTMDNLILVAKQVAMESSDKMLQSAMLAACDSAGSVGKKLLAVTRSISAKPSQEATVELLDTANAVLQTTMNILMIWDEAEVRRIVDAGQWFLDRLALVEGAQSQRGVVICFKGLSDALLHLLALVDKRMKELIYQEPREQLATCLLSLKEAIPQLSSIMQAFIHDKTNEEKRVQKNAIFQDIRDTLHNLLVAVSGSGAVGERAPSEGASGVDEMNEDVEREALFDFDEDNMATQMEKVQHQLSGIQRYSLDEDFNLYIDAIIRNSMAVAQVSKEALRNIITGLCHQVLAYHQKLLSVFEDMCQNPTSKDLKKAFDDVADQLSEKLIELDVAVGDSVINQVADVVVDASAPVERLVDVASATMLHSPSGSSVNLDQEIEDFKKHSRQLTQVAIYAAESAPDSKSMKDLRNVAARIETLTPQVIAASRVVNKDPDNAAALRRMEELKREWADAVNLLTQLLDAVTDPRDYIMAAETHIKDDIVKCRDSTKARNPGKLSSAITSLTGRAKRAAHVASNEALNSPDLNYKEPLLSAATQLDKDANHMSSEGNKLLQDFDDRAQSRKFARSVNTVQEDVRDVKTLMLSQPNVSMKEPTSTSTPISTTTTQVGARPTSGKRIVSSLATASHSAADRRGRTREGNSPKPTTARNIAPLGRSPQQAAETRPEIPVIQEQTGREFLARMDVKPQLRGKPLQVGDPPVDYTSPDPHLDRMPTEIVSERGTQQEEAEEDVDVSPATRLTRHPSYGEYDRGYSQSHTTGEVETQTPLARKRDSEIQTIPGKEKKERKASSDVKLVAVESTEPQEPPRPAAAVRKATRSTSTSNLYNYTHCEKSLQTSADLWDMDTIVDVSSPYAVYTLPVQRLISAAVTGDPDAVEKAEDVVSERLDKLTCLSEPLEVGLVNNDELLRSLCESSQAVKQLTDVVVSQSEDVADNPQKLSSLDDLRQGGKDLVEAIHQYADILDKTCLPWSQCAQRIIGSANNKRQMDAEITQLKSLVDQMMSVAKVTIEAGSAKMATQDVSQDHPVQEAIERIIQLCGEVQSLTSQFTTLTQSYHRKSLPSPLMFEELQLCAAQWAGTVKSFHFQMDCITLPTGCPVEALVLAGETGDRELLSKQTTYVKSLSSSLYDISKNATEDIKEDSLVQLLRSTSSGVEKLAAKLTDTAELMSDTRSRTQSVQYQRSAENGEILQREWAAKVLLVQVHIDDLTAHYGVVLDQMMAVAMTANSLDNEQEKEEYMEEFATMSALLEENLSKLEDAFVRLVRGLPRSLEIKAVSNSIDFLRKLNPYVFKSVRGLAREISSGSMDHFLHLKRQWSARALFLGANLGKILVIDMSVVNAIFEALISGKEVPENVCVVATGNDDDNDDAITEDEERSKSVGSLGSLKGIDSEGSLPRILEEDVVQEETSHVSTRRGQFSWDFSPDGDVQVTSDIVEDASSSRRDSEGSVESEAWEDREEEEEDEVKKSQNHVEEDVQDSADEEDLLTVKKQGRSHTLPSGIQMRHITSADKPRPMTVAGFSNWRASVEINPTSNSIAAAALSLHETVYSFEEGENPLLSIAKGMSEQMFQIAQYCRGRGDLKSQDDMIESARSVANDGQKIAKFVAMIAKHCTDTNMQGNLEHYAEVIPTTSKQLSIIAKVKAATPSDKSAELMLGKNAENLMKVVVESIKAAESACVKGLKVPEDDEEKDAVDLILGWKRKLDQHRYLETLYAPRTTRGLREVGKVKSDPSLADLVKSDLKFGRSP